MAYLRIAIAGLMLLIGALLGYASFAREPDQVLQQAWEAFVQEQFEEAESLLIKRGQADSAARHLMHLGYVLREAHQLAASSVKFLEAQRRWNCTEDSQELLGEIMINSVLNNYLAGDPVELEDLPIQMLAGLPKGYFEFLQGLVFYQSNRFQEARALWTAATPPHHKSRWLLWTFAKYFSKEWRSLSLAHCAIETGEPLSGRTALEKQAFAPLYQSTQKYLIALSYLKEGELKTGFAALPYYVEGCTLFAELPETAHSRALQRAAAEQVMHLALRLIQERRFEELLPAIRFLEGSQEEPSFLAFAQQLSEQLMQSKEPRVLEQTLTLLVQQLKQPVFKRALAQAFENLIFSQLQAGDQRAALFYFDLAKECAEHPAEMAVRICAYCEGRVWQMLSQNALLQGEGSACLGFWDQVEQERTKRYFFAKQIADLACRALTTAALEPAQIEQLLKLAWPLPFVQERPLLYAAVEKELQKVSRMAIRNESLMQMKSVIHLATVFGLTLADTGTPQEIANQIADAQYLLSVKRYAEAKRKIEWVLAMQPHHDRALQMLALLDH